MFNISSVHTLAQVGSSFAIHSPDLQIIQLLRLKGKKGPDEDTEKKGQLIPKLIPELFGKVRVLPELVSTSLFPSGRKFLVLRHSYRQVKCILPDQIYVAFELYDVIPSF